MSIEERRRPAEPLSREEFENWINGPFKEHTVDEDKWRTDYIGKMLAAQLQQSALQTAVSSLNETLREYEPIMKKLVDKEKTDADDIRGIRRTLSHSFIWAVVVGAAFLIWQGILEVIKSKVGIK